MRAIALFAGFLVASAVPVRAQDLVMTGGSMELAGINRYNNVCLTGGATLNVTAYGGGDKKITGNLELIAGSIYIDATSKIVARGRGYQPLLCSTGGAPNATGGGRGGCSVMDSGGGGAHFGKGGRGTVDNPTATTNLWQNGFPTAFEDDCKLTFSGNACTGDTQPNGTAWPGSPGNPYRSRTLCWKSDTDVAHAFDVPTCATPPCTGPNIAGVQYWHNIYQSEFGAAGGDKGCRDGDGRSGNPVAGAGGGRVVLVALNERNPTAAASPCGGMQGVVRIEGTIEANGKRGCGSGNDSGGGGGGGSVLVVGQKVTIGTGAHVLAAGGLGGDTNAKGSSEGSDCPTDSQDPGGTCDDCGGGGGGGIISVLSLAKSDINPGAEFNVKGALGGVCTICNGEAGGGAGELQLDGAYVGEYCDGFDNDFDGNIDEGLGTQGCGLGSCNTNIASCSGGVPVTCVPNTSTDATCLEAAQDARPRIAVIVDTSASMLLDLSGYPTFGDGSLDHPGISTTGTAATDDSRLFLAGEALGQVISAYPEIDFSLARYHQDQALNRSCQTAKWFECQGLVASYDNPAMNTGTKACDVTIPGQPTIAVNQIPGPVGSECINYAGSCGPPRRGADILSGFGTPVRDMVRWLDHRETMFDASATPGDVCLHSQGKDCELRGSGPTPLAGSLQAIEDYVAPIRTEDAAKSCRGYTTILVTDGAESCNGDPVVAAKHLYDTQQIQTYVVAVSVLPEERASLNAIAAAGSPPASPRMATFVTQPEQLVPALTSIIGDSIKYESCNSLDDDCDGKVDEDFPGIGNVCGDTMKGVCRSTGTVKCNNTHDGTTCIIDKPGQTPGTEVCNSRDDNCNGAIDEGLDCTDTNCMPKGEECDGSDNDCDGKVDEDAVGVGNPCGLDVGECKPGMQRCVNGELRCVGGTQPGTEQCNGKDDDCDGMIDDDAMCPAGTACIEGACRNKCIGTEFSCPVGQACERSEVYLGDYCIPTACALCKTTERCENDVCIDPCEGVSCDPGLVCVRGDCRDCYSAGCPGGQLCYQGECLDNRCATLQCDSTEFCFDGACVPLCKDASCPKGQSCGMSGSCEADACAGVVCETGEACLDGKCQEDPCRTMGCTTGYVCVSQSGCVPDACTITVCADGTLCSVGSHGEPRCQVPVRNPEPTKPRSYVSTGGSGLTSCSVGRVAASESPPWAALSLSLLGFAVWRRRRRLPRKPRWIGSSVRRRCGWASLLLLGGCKTDAICLDCIDASTVPAGDTGVQTNEAGIIIPKDGEVGDDDGGGGSGGSDGPTIPGCVKLGDEVCNQLDDDCDGKTDEDFDFMTNVRHCGGCDQPCRGDNADTTCQDGQCVIGACQNGFADLDADPGCEYRCPFFPTDAENCNGSDDDCDGKIDEELVAPAGDTLCRSTPGTPCANVKTVCATREKLTTWFCDYPSSVDFDPIVPDGIAKEEQECDGQDNDCDGLIDEPWPELGNACDDGKIGACRNGGALACGSDKKSTFCDLSLPPDAVAGAGPSAPELCNDLDDNCDGIVDNPTGASRVIDDMKMITRSGQPAFYIYTYEASRPDSTGTDQGVGTARSCSKSGAKPWTLVSYSAAAAACAVSGKRLCTANEWLWACEGDANRTYPYGTSYVANTCNGADHDTQAGGGLDNAVVATGSMTTCQSPGGTYDQSGNVKEWTSEQPDMNDPIYVVRGGSFESPQLGLTCQTELSQATASTVLEGLGFRCCSTAAP